MPSDAGLSRRRFASTACCLLLGTALAGCTDSGTEAEPTVAAEPTATGTTTPAATTVDGRTDPPADGTTAGDDPGTSTGRETADSSGTADDLDLREANVVGVAVEPASGGYRFGVSLHHDDGGEDGYANWWQVERPDGTRLGRRDLLHPHAEQPFRRWETIEVPDDSACVVVRGHDQTHGYGGQATVVDPDSGATRTVPQGPEPVDLAGTACP